MKTKLKVVAFDVMETLFPLDPLRGPWQALGLPAAAVELWFARFIRNALALDATGVYQPFGEVARSTLAVMLTEHSQPADGATLDSALAGLATLPAHSEVLPAFQLLHEASLRIVALTNGSAANTARLLERSGLTALVERVISIDEVRRWKPAREVYLHAASVVSVAPDEMALVAVHAWDVHGANKAGLTTGWVSRLEKQFQPLMTPPDISGATVNEVCRQLLNRTIIPPAIANQ